MNAPSRPPEGFVYIRLVRRVGTGTTLLSTFHVPYHSVPRNGDSLAVRMTPSKTLTGKVREVVWSYTVNPIAADTRFGTSTVDSVQVVLE